MKVIRNEERMERRCEKLKELGFSILHQDSKVGVPIGHGQYFEFDFSGIDENKFLEVALRKCYVQGIRKGETDIQDRIKQVMGIK